MPTVGSLATHLSTTVGAHVVGDADRVVVGVAPLDAAGPEHVSFFTHPKYRAALDACRAGVVILDPQALAEAPTHRTYLVSERPYLAMAHVAQLLHPPAPLVPGIHPTAWIDPSAEVHPSAQVGPKAVVEAGAQVGPGCHIEAQAFLGREVVLGEDCRIGAGAKVLHRCRLGARVILQPGAVVGSDGFGYAPDAQGRRHRIPQVGVVILEDDVEVGANTTIDRATFGETRIGRGTKIDNLVQVAHNVTTGGDCVLVSQSGIAGSTRLGHRVIVGAQGGMVGHITVGNDVLIGARGALSRDTPEAGAYSGAPAFPHRQWLRAMAVLRELPSLRKRLLALEERHGRTEP